MTYYITDMKKSDIQKITPTEWTTVTTGKAAHNVGLQHPGWSERRVLMGVGDDVTLETAWVIADYLGQRIGREVKVIGVYRQ